MARYNENECAYCAEEVGLSKGIIGADWKVYCSPQCTRQGEALSRSELFQLMQLVTDRRGYDADRPQAPTQPQNFSQT
jgi:hypothetical protein